jgi:hypothetical protein
VFGRTSAAPAIGIVQDVSVAGFLEDIEARRSLLADLQALDPSGWAADDDIDRRVLIGLLDASINYAEAQRAWTNDPNIYVPSAELNRALQSSGSDRARALTAILQATPERLLQGRQALIDPPLIFTREAIVKTRGTIAILDRDDLAPADQPPAVRDELIAARDRALSALTDYLAFLEGDLINRPGDSWMLGREAFDYALRTRWNMDLTAEDLLARGERAMLETERMAQEVARRIDPDATHWQQVYRQLEAHHPTAEGLKDAYQTQIDAARLFLIENDIVSLTPGERVITVDTPPAMRASSPFGTFQSVDPFGDDLTGKLVLTPIDTDGTPEQIEASLRRHPNAWIPIIAAHEAYPGHHVDGLMRRDNPRLLRKMVREPIMSEGWGLFVEEMMFREGFLRGDDVRLSQIRNRMWRAARVVLDVSLHTGRMTPEEAIAYLKDRVGFDDRTARLDVTMYMHGPTYASAYLIGMEEIQQIEADYIQRFGEPEHPKDLYDRLLGVGSLPPAYVREILFDQ